MHEAGAVMSAIQQVIRDWPPGRTTGDLRLEIVDGTRADAEAVTYFATVILGDLGLDSVNVSVHTRALVCDACGDVVIPELTHPLCEMCGSPLRRRAGPAIVGEDTTGRHGASRPS